LYGITGGSGGETTSGVFLGIAFTGLFTVLICMFLLLAKFKTYKSKWYWLFLLIIIGILEMRIIDWRTVISLIGW